VRVELDASMIKAAGRVDLLGRHRVRLDGLGMEGRLTGFGG